jgi:hypothetical protein
MDIADLFVALKILFQSVARSIIMIEIRERDLDDILKIK